MTPSQAILEAVRDLLRTNIPLRNDFCDNQPSGKPPARSGQYYVSVFPLGVQYGGSADQHLGIDRKHGIGLGITQRTGVVPDDRLLREALFQAKGALTLAEECDRVIRANRYAMLDTASAAFTGTWTAGKLCEPLQLTGSSWKAVKKGPEWFSAAPPTKPERAMCQDFGMYVEVRYTGARYLESLIP